MSISIPRCPSCTGEYGNRTAFCNDINPVHDDCFYMLNGIKHTHVFCAGILCKAHWIEFEGRLVKPLKLKMLKMDINRKERIKHG